MSAELQMKEMSGSKSKDELLLIVRRLTFVRQPKLLSLIERRELKRALEAPTCGDLLLVTKLDRLARSTRDLLRWREDKQARHWRRLEEATAVTRRQVGDRTYDLHTQWRVVLCSANDLHRMG
jgi:hypothetical protein